MTRPPGFDHFTRSLELSQRLTVFGVALFNLIAPLCGEETLP